MDEVVANFMDKFLEFYNSENQTSFYRDDFHTYDFWKILGGNRLSAVGMVNRFYNSDFFSEIELMPGARAGILELSKKHDLSIITARQRKFKRKTNEFMEKHLSDISLDVFYIGFYNTAKGKSKICKKMGVDLMIEDNKKYALSCAKTCREVYLFDAPWNQNSVDKIPENITRVYGWENILNGISNGDLK